MQNVHELELLHQNNFSPMDRFWNCNRPLTMVHYLSNEGISSIMSDDAMTMSTTEDIKKCLVKSLYGSTTPRICFMIMSLFSLKSILYYKTTNVNMASLISWLCIVVDKKKAFILNFRTATTAADPCGLLRLHNNLIVPTITKPVLKNQLVPSVAVPVINFEQIFIH